MSDSLPTPGSAVTDHLRELTEALTGHLQDEAPIAALQAAIEVLKGQVLEQRVQERTTELQSEQVALQAFMQFTEAAGRLEDTSELVQLALDTLQTVLPGSSVGFYEKEGNFWHARQLTADMEPDLQAILKDGLPGENPIFARMVETRAPVFVNQWNKQDADIEHSAQYRQAILSPIWQGNEIRSALAVGLQDGVPWAPQVQGVLQATAFIGS